MTNAEIFKYPGEKLSQLLLSLFNSSPSAIDPELFWLMSVAISILVWLKVANIISAVIKKVFGFDNKSAY